jgi:endonuclease/exonuclease/phosphatase family metal-dependent hydrolase
VPERLRVATLNIWGRNGDWPRRRALLRAGFGALQPDLVALQERVVTDGYDQVADVFGSNLHRLHQSQRNEEGLGCSIVSRWPVAEVTEVDLCVTERVDPADFVGRSTVVELDHPLGRLVFVNHKPSWRTELEHERELQALTATSFIERLARDRDVHVVVAGDFDARPETSSIRFWTGRQSLGGASVHYQDAWESIHSDRAGHTFTLENPLIVAESDWSLIPPRRIDYIMVRCVGRGPTLRIAGCERLFDEEVDGVWASDHFGVTAELAAPTDTSAIPSLRSLGSTARP